MNTTEPTPEQTIADLREQLARMQAETARLDWLQRFCLEKNGLISEPSRVSAEWQLGYPDAEAFIVVGRGQSLREAIDDAQ